jgi:hypothetical protein
VEGPRRKIEEKIVERTKRKRKSQYETQKRILKIPQY